VFIRGDVGRDDEDLANMLRKLFDMLATAMFNDLIDDQFLRFFGQACRVESFLEEGADIVEEQVVALIVDMADISEGEDGLAAVAFAACHRSDCTGRGDGGLGGIADAVGFDAINDPLPVQFRSLPVAFIGAERGRNLPGEVIRVVDAALDHGEGAKFFRHFHAGFHREVADKLHHLTAEFQRFLRAITHTAVVHQIRQPHDAQADAAGVMRSNFELRDSWNVGVLIDNVVEEARCCFGHLAEFFPVHGAVFTKHLSEVDGTEAAVLIGSQPLLAAGVGGFEFIKVRDGVVAVGSI